MNPPSRRSPFVRIALGVAMWALPGSVLAAENSAPIQRPTRVAAQTGVSEAAAPTPTPQPEPPPQPTPAAEAQSAQPAQGEFTSSPAPPSPPPAAVPPPNATRSSSGGGALHASHEPEAGKDEKLPHRGFTVDARIGAAGCVRSLCTSSHNASPGLRVDGFLGGNIRGFVDLGIAGGWGSYSASVEQNSNLLRLYGIEPGQLQAAATAMGSPLGFNPFALQVQSAKLRTAQVGPALRVHLIPRGRGIAYLGAGVGYSTFLADYDTAVGDVSMRFHGIDVPLQAGGGVQITKHLAAVVQFDYTFNNYPVARFEHPQESLTLPVAFLDSAARESTGTSVSDSLPQSWAVSAGLRARF